MCRRPRRPSRLFRRFRVRKPAGPFPATTAGLDCWDTFLVARAVGKRAPHMRVDLFGLAMDAPGVTAYLWSPWRCSALEHKMFDSLTPIPGVEVEKEADELRLHITDPKAWKQ